KPQSFRLARYASASSRCENVAVRPTSSPVRRHHTLYAIVCYSLGEGSGSDLPPVAEHLVGPFLGQGGLVDIAMDGRGRLAVRVLHGPGGRVEPGPDIAGEELLQFGRRDLAHRRTVDAPDQRRPLGLVRFRRVV